MKRLVIKKPFCVEIEEVKIPALASTDFLIKTEVSGISIGTEMTLYRGTHPNLKTKKWGYWTDYPIYPGYEAAGVVVKCGHKVKDFSLGDRVICVGTHAEYIKISARNTKTSVDLIAVKLPDNVSFEQATLAPLATTTMHAIRRANFTYRDTVTIIGTGVVGLLALQHARLAGAGCIIAIDIDEKKLQIAQKLGANYTINAQKQDPVKKVGNITGIGSDIVIEATGASEPVKQSLVLARDRGRILILGFHTKPVDILFGDDFFHKELEIISTRAMGPSPGLPHSYVRWTAKNSLKEAVEQIAKGSLQVDKLITHTLKYTNIKKVYKKIDEGNDFYLQVLLDWR
ncbi:MAG: zinc-binding alcohol dehydrogenase [Nitrospirae bacterium]|nr:zinc-binding alcohol dehydrogenase [Nitrospirota bacterium]